MAATVLLTALTAREMGGGRTAQTIAAVSAATVPVWLGGAHLMSTTAFDVLVWAALIYLFTRIVTRGDGRLWLLAGAVAGVGLENKWNVLFLAGSLAVGLIANGQWRLLANRWLAGGALIALLLWLPNLIWQSDNGWPSLEMLGNLHDENVDDGVQATFIPSQIVYVGPFLLPIWIAGLVRLFRNPDARPYRALGIAYPLLFVWFLASAGKPYYLSGLYVGLLAAGAIAVEGWLVRGGGRIARSPRAVVTLILIGAIPGTVIGLPILSEQQTADAGLVNVNYDLGEQIAWPAMVGQIATAYERAGLDHAADPVILTGNYGEAGAVDRYGGPLGLPRSYSGQNSYSAWGPPPGERSDQVLGVGLPVAYMERFFDSCTPEGRLDDGLDLDTDEQGEPLTACTGQRLPWPELWPKLRRYG
jgi:hypothetical protein